MNREYLITLPWPPKELSPNYRAAHRHTTKHRQSLRDAGFYAAKEVKAEIPEDAHLDVIFYPPDNRRRDLDNLLGSIKYGLDGMAKAAGVDDYGWTYSIRRGPKHKGGAVLIHVRKETFAAKAIELRGVVT